MHRTVNARRRFLAALLVLFVPALTAAAKPDGASIITEFLERHQVPWEMEQLTVKLVGPEGRVEEVRKMRRYTRRFGEGNYRHLLVIDDPPALAGTALLAWQEPGKPNRYWSHLPAEGETRERVTRHGGGRSYFMGTDLTYEDIAMEHLSNYNYERRPDQHLDGFDVFVLRATPASAKLSKESGYKHRDLFLRQDNYALLRVDYFNPRGRFIKRLEAQEAPVHLRDRAWRVDHFIMNNRKADHQTELIVVKRELEEIAVPAPLFDPKNLGRHSALVKLKP